MKQRCSKKLLSALLVFSLLLSLGVSFPTLSGNKAVSKAAEGGFQDLSQAEIVKAMGPGWNLGNQLESNSGGTPIEDTWSHVMITERLIRTVARSGFQSIRIPVSYLSMIGSAPDYTINETWLNRVQEVVDWAIKYDLYVVINIHGDGYSTVTGGWILPDAADQETIKAKFEKVWVQIADRFKDYDEHMIFESMNEIGAHILEKTGVTDDEIRAAYENINAYNQIFVDTVRQSGGNNDKRWLLVPGINTNIDYTTGDYGFRIPEDTYRSADIPEQEKRIMISVHYYDPWVFCGLTDYGVTQWGSEADSNKSVGYGQESDMRSQFAKLKESFTDQGYPVVIGEYGSIDKSQSQVNGDSRNNEFRAYYASEVCSQSLKNGCIPMYWDNAWNGEFGFGLFDRETYEITQPEILQAILSCYKQGTGTATAVSIDKHVMKLDLADNRQSLQATLTPSDSTDTIQWETSDPTVATVSYKGNVVPAGIGTCIITATAPSGASDYCIVEVTAPESFKAGLYAGNSSDWNTLECSDYLTLSENGGGTYTISLTATKTQMSMLNTLFIKDVTVQREVAEESILQKADFTVDWMKLNDYDCTLSRNEFTYEKSEDSTTLDLCMLNYWYEEANCIGGLTKSAVNQCYSFPSAAYVEGDNTLTMQVTIKNAVLEEQDRQEVDVTSLTLSKEELTVGPGYTSGISATTEPSQATEKVVWFSENPNVATVDKDGVVTGVAAGETIVHALTISGQDVTCTVKVEGDAKVEPTNPTDKDPNASPGVQPSEKPSGNKEDTSGGNGNTAMATGTSFTVGKLKYKVTGATGKNLTAAVQAPKSKKAKSLTIPATVKKGKTTYKVTSIAAGAFKKCAKLKKLTIGKNVTTIGKNAFNSAKVLKKITVKSTKLKKIGKKALKGIHKKAVIKVPKKKVKKYRKLFKGKGQKKSVKVK